MDLSGTVRIGSLNRFPFPSRRTRTRHEWNVETKARACLQQLSSFRYTHYPLPNCTELPKPCQFSTILTTGYRLVGTEHDTNGSRYTSKFLHIFISAVSNDGTDVRKTIKPRTTKNRTNNNTQQN